MSCIPQLPQPSGQIWGAKKEDKGKLQFLPENAPTNLAMPILNLSSSDVIVLASGTINSFRRGGYIELASGIIEKADVLKNMALAIARNDKSIPLNLRLRKGAIKEIDKGVFVKKTSDGVLEIYLSEE